HFVPSPASVEERAIWSRRLTNLSRYIHGLAAPLQRGRSRDGTTRAHVLPDGFAVTDSPPLTALHYVVLVWLARHSPASVEDIAATLGLPVPLVRALVADLELAEMVGSGGERDQ